MAKAKAITVDPKVVALIADGARKFWGERAAEGCREWAVSAALDGKAQSAAEWRAAADQIEAQ